MLYKTNAIVLRVLKYNEADKIVNLLSPEGRIGAISKGSRKVKSKFSGQIEPFCSLELVLHEGKNLHTITQASLIKAYKNIRLDYQKYLIASAAAELVDKITFSGLKDDALYRLLAYFFDYLDRAKNISPFALTYFDWQLIKILGFLPNLTTNDEQWTLNESWFNLKEGRLKVEALTIKLLKSIMDSKLSELKDLKIEDRNIKELVYITEQYLKHQLQVNLRSRKYFE